MISIIIPAHNAEHFIGDTLRELSSIKSAQIIVICNNCKDRTYERVEEIRKKRKNIINLNFQFYTGKGGAITRGFDIAEGSVIGFVDADNTFNISDIKKVITLTKKYDCVIGSKWKNKKFSTIKQPLARRIYSRFWNLLIKNLFDLEYNDTQAGLKFFRKQVIDKIGKNFTCTGFEFDVELLWKIKKAGYSIYEMPVKVGKRKKSTMRAIYFLPMLWNLMKLRFSRS